MIRELVPLFLFLLILLCIYPADAATVLVSDQQTTPGSTVPVLIFLDSAGTGLAGYVMDISLSEPGIASIENFTFPDWAGLHDITISDGIRVSVKAVDIYEQIKAGNSDILLGTLIMKGENPGSVFLVPEITALDDDAGNEIQATITPGSLQVSTADTKTTGQLHLYAGWNMVSIPVSLPAGEDTAGIFSDVPVDGHSIFTFFPFSGWMTVNPQTVIRQTDAYWVYAEHDFTLPVPAGTSKTPDKPLYPGWNLIGIPGEDPVPLGTVLSSAPSWVYLIRYDAANQRYEEPIVHDAETAGFQTDEILLVPGTGYFLFMREEGLLPGN
ncbi:MAG: hypothetical protein JXA44_02425 [Methanospirillaceae archaeon]|nr:hypothetical protein [Methanospirillaceae archaeon]